MNMWVGPLISTGRDFLDVQVENSLIQFQYIQVLLASIIHGFFSIQILSSFSRSSPAIRIYIPMEMKGYELLNPFL